MTEQTGRKHASYDLLSKYRRVLMGVAILSIILFHYAQDCVQSEAEIGSFIRRYYKYIGSGGVDVFLLLSGFGLYYSMKGSPVRSLKDFYRRRFIRVLIPYFFVAGPKVVLADMLIEGKTFGYCLSDLLFITFFREGSAWFWYIMMICICYLLFPYFYRLIDDGDDFTAQTRVAVLFCFFTVISLLFSVQAPKMFRNTSVMWPRFFPFVLGIYLGRVGYAGKRVSLGVFLFCCCSVFLLPLMNSAQIIVQRFIMMSFHILLYMILILLLEYSPLGKAGPAVKMLDVIGGYTLELYLTHSMTRSIFRILGRPCSVLKNEILMLFISIVLSVLLKRITRLFTAVLNKEK